MSADWTLIAVLITLLIGLLQPQLLYVSLYKLSLAATAAVCGYWIDRSVFPIARPGQFGTYEPENEQWFIPTEAVPLFATAQLRRALIIAALIIGVCLGA